MTDSARVADGSAFALKPLEQGICWVRSEWLASVLTLKRRKLKDVVPGYIEQATDLVRFMTRAASVKNRPYSEALHGTQGEGRLHAFAAVAGEQ